MKVTDEKSRIRSWSRIRIRIRKSKYGSEDPDPYQNVTDPELNLIMKNPDDHLEFSEDVTVLMQLEPAAAGKRLAAQRAAEPVPPLPRVSHQVGGQKVRLREGGAAMVRAGGEGTVQAAAARGSTVVFLLLLLNGVEEQLVFVLELRAATITPKRLTSYAVRYRYVFRASAFKIIQLRTGCSIRKISFNLIHNESNRH